MGSRCEKLCWTLAYCCDSTNLKSRTTTLWWNPELGVKLPWPLLVTGACLESTLLSHLWRRRSWIRLSLIQLKWRWSTSSNLHWRKLQESCLGVLQSIMELKLAKAASTARKSSLQIPERTSWDLFTLESSPRANTIPKLTLNLQCPLSC